MSLPKEDVLNMRKKQAIDTIIMTMAGRIAEEICHGRHFQRRRRATFNRRPTWRGRW